MSKIRPVIDIDTVAMEESDVSINIRLKLIEELISQQETELRMLKYHLLKLKEKTSC